MIFDNEYVYCSVDITDNDEIVLKGSVKVANNFDKIEVFAANPIDRMTNYSGSGLPFPCSRIAFESTPNYKVISNDGVIDTTFLYPNSYYTEDWRRRIEPSIFFKFSRAQGDPVFIRFELSPITSVLNVRTLTYRPGTRVGPEAYSSKEDLIPITDAEKTMYWYKVMKVYKDIA